MVESNPEQLIGEGERVHVSPATTDDMEPYRKAMEASARRIGVWNPVNPRDLEHHLAAQSDAHRTFLIRANEPMHDAPLVGCVNVSNVVRGRFMSATMGYNAFDPYVGAGFFREGLALVVGIALRQAPSGMGLHRLEANVRIGNSASAGLLRSLGFRRERTMRRMLWLADGLGGPSAWRDHDSYAVTREEWPATAYAAHDAVSGVLVLGSTTGSAFAVALARELGAVALFDVPFEAALNIAHTAPVPVLWCADQRADDAVQALGSRGVSAVNVDREVAESGFDARSITRVALALRSYLQ